MYWSPGIPSVFITLLLDGFLSHYFLTVPELHLSVLLLASSDVVSESLSSFHTPYGSFLLTHYVVHTVLREKMSVCVCVCVYKTLKHCTHTENVCFVFFN